MPPLEALALQMCASGRRIAFGLAFHTADSVADTNLFHK